MRYEDIKSIELISEKPEFFVKKDNITLVYPSFIYIDDGLLVADLIYSFTVDDVEDFQGDTVVMRPDLTDVDFNAKHYEGALRYTAGDLDNLVDTVEAYLGREDIKGYKGETIKDFSECAICGALDILSSHYLY